MESCLRRTLSHDYSVINNFLWNQVSEDQNCLVTALPSHEEIHDAIFGLDPAASPSPDGFSGLFYQKCWNVCNVIIHHFTSLDLPCGMNSSFVALIPKVAESIRVTDFRLIAMTNFIYKVYTKIIAMRLGSFIRNVLSPSQFGVISGHRIHTFIALASETINSLDLAKQNIMFLKIDITKAFIYCFVGLSYSRSVLHEFLKTFYDMIRGILNLARLSILINCMPHGYFSCSHGVCQGEPPIASLDLLGRRSSCQVN